MNHTPGPWTISEMNDAIDGEEDILIERTGFPLCTVRGTNDMSCMEDDEIEPMNKQVIATAKLIAAAPDLLDALHQIASRGRGVLKKIAQEAIAKTKP